MIRRRIPAARRAAVAATALGLAVLATAAGAVVLDDQNRLDVVLQDGTHVTLFGEAVLAAPPPGMAELGSTVGDAARRLALHAGGGRTGTAVRELSAAAISRMKAVLPTPDTGKTNRYYYLPTNLHLSKRPDGTPEFLFLKFTTEAAESQGGTSGGLLHFLMEWGLTPAQEQELKGKLQSQFNGAQLMGAAPVESDGEAASFQIVSASLADKSLAPSIVTSGKAPLVPGGKAAAASRLTATGAQLLAATFEKARSITDISVALNVAYQTLTPAARGTIVYNWDRLDRESNELRAEYKRTETGRRHTEDCFLVFCASSDTPEYSYSYDEVRAQYKLLEQKKIIEVNFDETLSDDRIAKIREAFFQYFVQALAQPEEKEQTPPPPASDKDKDQTPDIRTGNGYHFSQKAIKQAVERGKQILFLNYRLAVRHPFQLVGNMASWYDGVRDNPRCVASVNLNDPFFQHRDIHFILDLDAKEIFQEAVNYVTVNVRKTRTSGNAFEDHVTMDAKYVQDKGIDATVTYARGEDKNPDVYEYQAQWSLKGGYVFPPDPPWQKGNWEGVTLSPPVVPRTIEVEGNIADMTASGITRVTVQVHYPKFGEEVEENIHISPAGNQPLVAKKIFIDRGAKGYAYRLIVNHKTEGKLALPWSAQVGDDYIYATIPQDLLADGSSLKAQAKDAAKDLVNSAKQRVLDQFKDLLGGKP